MDRGDLGGDAVNWMVERTTVRPALPSNLELAAVEFWRMWRITGNYHKTSVDLANR